MLDTKDNGISVIEEWNGAEPSFFELVEEEHKVDYNDGKWYGWNGGECPVHKKSKVDYIWLHKDGTSQIHQNYSAGNIFFQGNEYGNLISFRVVAPYVEPKEPRDFWILESGYVCNKKPTSEGWIHVREVLE